MSVLRQQIFQDGLTHVEAARHMEEPWRRDKGLFLTTVVMMMMIIIYKACVDFTFKGASFKVQSYFSLLSQIAKPLSSLTIRKLPKGDFRGLQSPGLAERI